MDDVLSSVVLNRQRGLALELGIIANNVANSSTTGFRREGVAFAEHVVRTGPEDGVAMADLIGRFPSAAPGRFTETGRSFDLAIEGEGFFLLERGGQQVLTRAGAFQVSPDGTLVSPSGDAVLDTGGAPIFIPPEAERIEIGADGTIDAGAGPLTRIAVVRPPDMASIRSNGPVFVTDAPAEPIETPRLRQRALEGSNVDPIAEVARMIEVTRAYERAQALVDDQDSRVRNVLETLGRAV